MGKKHRRPIPNEFRQAVSLHQAGRFADAERIYRACPPGNPDALQLLGVLCFQTGRAEEGIALIRRALEIEPDHAEALGNLGVIEHERKHYPESLALFERALALSPGSADLLHKRGHALQNLGRHEEAISSFRLALEEVPKFPEALLNLGNSLQKLGRLDEAEESFRAVLAMVPGHVDALTNLGSVLIEKQMVVEAEQVLRRAIATHPTANAYHNLASALGRMDKRDEALRAAQTAISLEPNNADHHRVLGMLLQSFKKGGQAIAAFRKALDLEPGDAGTSISLATALNHEGRMQEALAVLDQVVEPTPGIQAARAIFVPVIPMNVEEIEEGRARVLDEFSKLRSRDIRLQDPYREIGLTHFFWSYHSKTELPLQRAASEFYRQACPELTWEADLKPPSGKIRVGVCSAHLNRHTIGKLFLRLIAGLREDDIEVVFFDPTANSDDWTKTMIDVVDESYLLSTNFYASREYIAEKRLDALFYPDIGMDPMTYFLAYSRLAPLQFMTWGHPVSTAIPNMDCFLSSVDLEREGGQTDYSERLVLFEDLMTVFTRPETPTATRADLGLPEDKHLYVCPQTSFKLHPDFDRVFAEILRRDPDGLVVLITGNEPNWDDLLKQRFARVMPDVAERIMFLGKLSLEHFLALNKLADAVLDTFYFGGGNSSLEVFSAGAPIVTLPGEMLRGRITLAQYRKMGISDLIAIDEDDYIEKALRLAQDHDWHVELSKKILERCPVLFDNQKPIEELRDFLRRECR